VRSSQNNITCRDFWNRFLGKKAREAPDEHPHHREWHKQGITFPQILDANHEPTITCPWRDA